MSDIKGFPNRWNYWKDPKTSKKCVSNLKTQFVMFIAVFHVFCFWIGGTNAAEVPAQKESKQKCGWLELNLNEASENTGSDSQSLKFCILNFRGIAGLGNFRDDEMEFVKTMLPILCEPGEEETRYQLAGSKWKSTNLSYRIISYPRRSDMLGGFARIDKEIDRAFTEWEKVTNLTFTKKYWPEADINIRFLTGEHGGHNFGAAAAAHATFPHDDESGEIHFNDDCEWTIGTSAGYDIFRTAVHEVGHALGLGHSKRTDSIMYPNALGYISNCTLHSDDIKAIQMIYGRSPTTQPKQENCFVTPRYTDSTWTEIAAIFILLGMMVALCLLSFVAYLQCKECCKNICNLCMRMFNFDIDYT